MKTKTMQTTSKATRRIAASIAIATALVTGGGNVTGTVPKYGVIFGAPSKLNETSEMKGIHSDKKSTVR